MATAEPQKRSATLGANADVNVLPATTPAGSGRASTGGLFPPITQRPLDEGGLAPERGDFNALFKYLGEYIYYAMQGGVYTYVTTYDYTAGNLVLHEGSLYLCIASNGPGSAIKYPTDTAYWRQLALTSQLPTVNNGTLTIQKDGATVATFTANQAGNTIANIAISEIDSQSVSAPGAGWVRFKSGIQIVFGAGSADIPVNYPVAFILPPDIQMTTPITAGRMGVPGWYTHVGDTTYFVGAVWSPVDNVWIPNGSFSYIAIGFWK